MTESVPLEPAESPIAGKFRLFFPQFADTPDEVIVNYHKIACCQIPSCRLGYDTQWGRMLLTAHLITINGAQGAASSGSVSAGFAGAVASKTVGSMSISYDTGGTAETDAGSYNSTIFGKQLWALFRQHRRMPFVAMGRALEP